MIVNINNSLNYIMETKSFVDFVETWLNQEPRKFQNDFENDVFLLLEHYGVKVIRYENNKVVRLGNAT